MPRRATSRNLFGLGKKITVHRHGGQSRRDVSSLAFKAGQRSGDSGLFSSWADSKHLKEKWDREAVRQFEKAYQDGVEKGEAVEARKVEQRETKQKASQELKEVQADVIEALAGLGMSRAQAKTLARSKYREGDSFGELFDRVMKRAPAGLKNPHEQILLSEFAKRFGTMREGTITIQKPRIELIRKDQKRYGGEIYEVIDSRGKRVAYALVVRRAPNPAKFDRCVADVSKSLKKSKRKGSPYAICTAAGTRNPKSKNPLEAARKLREDFTGLPAGEVLTYKEKDYRHAHVTGTGKLVCLDILTQDGREIPIIAPGFSFEPKKFLRRDLRYANEGTWVFDPSTPMSKVIQVTFSEDGKQLMFTGGDQSIPLEAMGFGPRDMRDNMFIGTIVEITYRTKKKFEQDGKEEVDFNHEFGRQGSRGMLPLLGYYLRSKQMFSLGGRYEIAPVRSDIGASPGIVG